MHFDRYLEEFRGPKIFIVGRKGEYDIDDAIALYRSGLLNRGRLYELLHMIVDRQYAVQINKSDHRSLSQTESDEKVDANRNNVMMTIDHWLDMTEEFQTMLQKAIEAGIVPAGH